VPFSFIEHAAEDAREKGVDSGQINQRGNILLGKISAVGNINAPIEYPLPAVSGASQRRSVSEKNENGGPGFSPATARVQKLPKISRSEFTNDD